MKWVKENAAPIHANFLSGMLINIGLWWILLTDTKFNLIFTFCIILICCGFWLLAWWIHEEHPSRFQKIPQQHLRFYRRATHIGSWVALILVIFVVCFFVLQRYL